MARYTEMSVTNQPTPRNWPEEQIYTALVH
jgi:hypothetical protein